MSKIGFITLQRTILEWEWYTDLSTKVLFIHLLLKANFADTKYRGLPIKRGDLVTGLEALASQTGLTTKKVRLSLTKLERSGEISQATGNQGRVITICKYNDYQEVVNKKGKQKSKKGQTKDKRKTNKGQHNNKKNNDNNTIKAFQPPEYSDFEKYLLEELPKLNPEWNPERVKRVASLQYETYTENNWRDGNGKQIKIWKTKAKNSIIHKKPWSYGSSQQGSKANTSLQNVNQYQS